MNVLKQYSASARGDIHLQLLLGMTSSGQRVSIGRGWEFTQLGGGPANIDGEWLRASKVPTSVQAEVRKILFPYPSTMINCSP